MHRQWVNLYSNNKKNRDWFRMYEPVACLRSHGGGGWGGMFSHPLVYHANM